MNKEMYKQLVTDLTRKNSILEEENIKLRIALCNLRDEYLDMGGDTNQLELFDKDNPSQLKIYESPDGGETVYQRDFGSDSRDKISGKEKF
jgi:hypothetical protein